MIQMGASAAHDTSPGGTTDGKTQDVFQKIVNSRKSYKMLKGASEAVWPPYLEESLLKGFESYEPEDCRETRLLGRFPMRNQYISDFIYRTTGKRRTAKQVGSRLQQLRDTPEGKRLLNSLMQNYNLGGKPISTAPLSDFDSPSSEYPLSPTSSNSSGCSRSPSAPLDTPVRRTFVRIDVLPMDVTSSCSTYHAEQFHGASLSADEVFSSNGMTNIFRPSSRPRPICSIDPTITFVSQSVISAESSCSVLLDGATVHHEVTPLTLSGSCADGRRTVDCQLLYGVQLVPSYWKFLVQSPDLTRYTIVQRVVRLSNISRSHQADDDALMFSAVYHFSYAATRDHPTTPVSSSPVFPENNDAGSYAAMAVEHRHSNTWYPNSLSPMDMGPLSTTASSGCGRSASLSLGNDCDISKVLRSEDAVVVSPISSCFPMDLSNYID